MKRLIILAFALLLSGCLDRTEISKIWLVSGLGIDKTDTGYLVTVQVLNPTAIVGENPGLPVHTFSAEGATYYEAYQKADNLTVHVLYMSHLSAIIVDEAVAEEGINSVLDFALRHVEIRPDVNVLVAKEDRAEDILKVLTPIETIPSMQLDIFTNMVAEHTARLINYNLYDIINLMNTPGVNAVLDVVTLEKEPNEQAGEKTNEQAEEQPEEQPSEDTNEKSEEEGGAEDNVQSIAPPVQLTIKQLAVFNDDNLIGYINQDDAQLYNILRKKNKRYVIKTKVDNEYYTSFEIEELFGTHKTFLEEEKVIFDFKIKGTLTENRYPIDLSNSDNVKIIESYFEKQLEQDLMAFLEKTQKELAADVIGIGQQAYYTDNNKWSEVQGYWDEIYPRVDFKVNVEIKLKSVGVIENIR